MAEIHAAAAAQLSQANCLNFGGPLKKYLFASFLTLHFVDCSSNYLSNLSFNCNRKTTNKKDTRRDILEVETIKQYNSILILQYLFRCIATVKFMTL